MHRHFAVGQLALHHVDIDGGWVGHRHRDVHEHLATMLADFLKEGQARMTDGVRHRPAGRLRRIPSVDVHAHPEFQHLRLCGHTVPPIVLGSRLRPRILHPAVTPVKHRLTSGARHGIFVAVP
jgi:hypothetical protein